MSPLSSLLLTIRDDEFALFQALIRREAGINYGNHKKPLLSARLATRLRARGARTFAEYYRQLKEPDGGHELVRMLDCICTNETSFFREPTQFELLERELIPAWIQGGCRRIRVWSAACSTGEEPYSAAMVLLHHLPPEFSVEILATDLSSRALESARKGVFHMDRAREIPTRYLYGHVLRGEGPQEGKMKAGPELRRVVTFGRHNLNDDTHPVQGPFDLILCRNVLIYFDSDTRAAVLSRLTDCLKPGGYLFLGHAESMSGPAGRMKSVMPAVYRRKPEAAATVRATLSE